MTRRRDVVGAPLFAPVDVSVEGEEQLDQLMIAIVAMLFFLAGFAVQVLAVVIGLWIWHRWPVLATLPRRTSA
jgi:hypothetical protein